MYNVSVRNIFASFHSVPVKYFVLHLVSTSSIEPTNKKTRIETTRTKYNHYHYYIELNCYRYEPTETKPTNKKTKQLNIVISKHNKKQKIKNKTKKKTFRK